MILIRNYDLFIFFAKELIIVASEVSVRRLKKYTAAQNIFVKQYGMDPLKLRRMTMIVFL